MSLKTTLAASALILAGSFGLWSLVPASPAFAQDTAPAAEAPAMEIKDMALGSVDAPVTLIEYASYTCPHCANFHETIFKPLKTEYIDTGKVRFIYREVYFERDRPAFWAAMVARCGGEMRYFAIQDSIFARQREWLSIANPADMVESLKKSGLVSGLDKTALDACMQDATMAQGMLDLFNTNMTEYDIEGTPTLIINGTKHANMSYADLKTILDAEIAKE